MRDESADILRGIGIILVVIGHVFSYKDPLAQGTYTYAKEFIYLFHMPLFMFISGLVFFKKQHHVYEATSTAVFIRQRANRLLVPFFGFMILVVLAKYISGYFGKVDDPVDSLMGGLLSALTNSENNPALSIWFLLVLFVYSLVTPYIFRFVRSLDLLVLLSLVIYFCHPPKLFYLDRIFEHYIFFCVGSVFANSRVSEMKSFQSALTSILCLLMLCMTETTEEYLLYGLVVSLALYVFFNYADGSWSYYIKFVGSYSMSIYLMNTLIIGFVKFLFQKIGLYKVEYSSSIFIASCIIGVCMPILIVVLTRRIHFLRPLQRYIE
jgi:fucose 4-O-acetylase-like acetyltransferase